MSKSLTVNPKDVFPSIVVTYNNTKRIKLQSSVLYRIPFFEEKIIQSKNNKIRVEHSARYEIFLILMNIIAGSDTEVNIHKSQLNEFVDLILDWKITQLYSTALTLCQVNLPNYVQRLEQLINRDKEESEIYKEYYQLAENTDYRQVVNFIVKSYNVIQSSAFKFFKKAAPPKPSDLEYAINALSKLDTPFFNSLTTLLHEHNDNLKEFETLRAQIKQLKDEKEKLEKENSRLKEELDNKFIHVKAASIEILDSDDYNYSDDYNISDIEKSNKEIKPKQNKIPINKNILKYKKLLKSIFDDKLLDLSEYQIIKQLNKEYEHDWNPLLTAVVQGKTNIVEKLSKSRDLVTWTDSHQNNLLHYSALKNNCEVTEILLRELSIDSTNENDQTPLHIACLYGSLDVVQLLLERNADINPLDYKCHSVFHLAAMQNNSNIVEELFDREYDDSLLEEDERGDNPLVIAVKSGSSSSVSVFIQNMAEPSKNLLNIALELDWEYDESIFTTSSIKDSMSTVMESQYMTNLSCFVSDMVRELNQMENFNQWLSECNNNGDTPIHLAIIHRHKDALNLILKNSDEIKFQPDMENRYPAEIAITERLPDYLRMLVDCDNYPIDRPCSNTSLSLLMKAIKEESFDCFNVLIRCPRADKSGLLKYARQKGAPDSIVEEIQSFSSDLMMSPSSENDPPLNPPSSSEGSWHSHRAQPPPPPFVPASIPKPKPRPPPKMEFGSSSEIELASESSAVPKPARVKDDVLIVAAQRGSEIEIRLRLENDPKYMSSLNDYNNDGRSILHIAALNGRDSIIRYLLKLPNLLVNEKDNLGKWPLYLAIENLKFHTASILMESPAIDYTIRDLNSQTILHVAGMKGAQELIPKIISHMEDPNARDKDGKTALHIAAQRGQINSVRMMVSSGMSPVEEDNEKRNVLHIAAVTKRIDIVEFLVSTRMDLDLRDINGKTAMYLAAENDAIDIVNLLIRSGADPNIPDKEDKTLVVFAAIRERSKLLETLLSSPRVDPNIPTKLGRTALHLAAMGGRSAIVNMLLNHARRSKGRKGPGAEIPVDPNIGDSEGRSPFFLAITNRRDEIALEMAKNPLIDIMMRDNAGKMASEYTRNVNILQLYSDRHF